MTYLSRLVLRAFVEPSLVRCLSLGSTDVDNMNAFIEEDPSLAGLSLRKLVKTTEGTIFNNAAQARANPRDSTIPLRG